MKLYQSYQSPFATRVRAQIYAKGLEGQIELVEPPGGTGSEAYLKLNPLGKVPALEIEDGSVIPESEVICEYLEDRFPEPALRPADPLGRARVRLLSRFTDLYLHQANASLFRQFIPATRDPAVLQKDLDQLSLRLDQLEGLLSTGPYAIGEAFTLADCALLGPVLFLTRVAPMLGGKNPLDGRPRLGAWLEQMRRHPASARIIDEMRKVQQAIAQQMARQRGQ